MLSMRGRVIGGLILLAALGLLLTVCDENDSDPDKAREAQRQREAQHQTELKAQLEEERAKGLAAERRAQEMNSSRNLWIGVLAGGGCAASVVVLLIGVHIGSRGVQRFRKEHRNG